MKKTKIVHLISIGGLLTAITVLFQSAPIFLPAIGLAFSPFSTVPIALAAVINVFLGFTVLFSSVFILILVSPQEATILLFTTGLLGITLGSLLYRKGLLVTILASAVVLSLGMIVLTYVAAIPAFVAFTGSYSLHDTLLIFFIFSLVYVSIWFICLRVFAKHIIKLRLIEKPHYKDTK